MQHVHLKVHRQAFHVAQDVENLPTDLELVRQIKAFVFLFTISGDQKKMFDFECIACFCISPPSLLSPLMQSSCTAVTSSDSAKDTCHLLQSSASLSQVRDIYRGFSFLFNTLGRREHHGMGQH